MNPRWFGLCVLSACLAFVGLMFLFTPLAPFAVFWFFLAFVAGREAYHEDLKDQW